MKALKQQLSKESVAGVLFTLPFTIGFLLFMLVPMGISLYYSFCDYDILSPPVFTGLKNFISMFQDETFFKTLKVTFFFAFVSVPLKLLFALIVAMLLLENSKMSGFYRAAYYLPSIIGGSVAVSILWKRMFAMDGVVNKLLGMVGIQTSFSWLGDTRTAIWVLILLVVWQFGSSMLIFLSSLKQVPQSLYEAARIDGASKPRMFFKITLPMITSIAFFNIIMQLITALQNFTSAFVVTSGGPNKATYVLGMKLYTDAFKYFKMGYACATSWILFMVILVMTIVLFVTSKKWVYYDN